MRKVLLILAVAAVFGWLQIAKSIDTFNGESKVPNGIETKDSTSASKDPLPLQSEKKIKKKLVREFVSTYFGRDKSMFVGDVETRSERFAENLEPLVSESFLEVNLRPLDLSQDVELVRSGGSVEARIAYFTGGHDNEIPVTVVRAIKLPGKKTVRIQADFELTLIKESGEWQVYTLREIS